MSLAYSYPYRDVPKSKPLPAALAPTNHHPAYSLSSNSKMPSTILPKKATDSMSALGAVTASQEAAIAIDLPDVINNRLFSHQHEGIIYLLVPIVANHIY